LCCAHAHTGHPQQKLFQPQGVAVEHWEELFPGLTLVLGLAAAEDLGERAPEGIQASVDHLEIRADIGGFGPIEKRICLGGVGVEAVVSLEHDGYFHSDGSYGTRHPESKKPGWIVKPIFKVVDWMSMAGPAAQEENEQPETQAEDPQPQVQATARRQSTVQPNGNGATAPQSTRRGSTIGQTPSQADATAIAGTEPAADPIVRRRRRVAS